MKLSMKTILEETCILFMYRSFILLCGCFSLKSLIRNFVNTQKTEFCFIFRVAVGPAQ